jgi:hypothetical protein
MWHLSESNLLGIVWTRCKGLLFISIIARHCLLIVKKKNRSIGLFVYLAKHPSTRLHATGGGRQPAPWSSYIITKNG